MKCPDPPVHPAASSALRGPLRALAVFAVLDVAVWVVTALAPLWAAALLAEAVLVAAGIWALQRQVWYGGWRKPARQEVNLYRPQVSRAELAAPPLALPAARPVVDAVITDARERTRR